MTSRRTRLKTQPAADPLRLLALYYIATGVWPILHLRSFMLLTGPKTDTWLVRTFGALIAGLGTSLLAQARGDGRRAAETTAVAVALTLVACEVWFVARGAIRPIYLADAALELVAAAALLKD